MKPNIRPIPAMLAVVTVWFVIAATLYLSGCAALSPGADPFVVRVEQTQAGADASFDLVLHLDNSDRGFWRTNAPGFHTFCEWLRTPTPLPGTNVPRCVAIQLNVQSLKQTYKADRLAGNSNALWSAWIVLNGAIGQANSWSNIIVHPIH